MKLLKCESVYSGKLKTHTFIKNVKLNKQGRRVCKYVCEKQVENMSIEIVKDIYLVTMTIFKE